ncbi:MAG: hypothetical protein KA764_09055, partial [Anaerolineales bacterium]|nr:hypothetical protein [Anaerolineales bacterium]
TGEFAGAFEAVVWRAEPEAEQQAARLPALAADVLFYAAREAVRNAARHGRPAAGAPLTLSLRLEAQPNGLGLVVEDDGVGFTGSGPAGHGLALHGALLGILGGALRVESEPGAYTRVSLTLPLGSDRAAGPAFVGTADPSRARP